MSSDAFRRTDEIGTVSLPCHQTDDDGGGIREGDWPDDARPASVRRPLQTKEEQDAAKERSMELRLPNSSDVHVGGRQERFLCRLGFQGTTAMAPRVA